MRASEGYTTSSALLRNVRHKNDQLAWESFVRFYSPLLRQSCRGLRLDENTANEVAQRVWVELMTVMPEFSYRRGFGFRRWLKTLCRHRAVDLIRQRNRERERLHSLDEHLRRITLALSPIDEREAEFQTADPSSSDLSRKAFEICQTVRKKTQETNWQAFWHVTVDGWTVREAADALNMTYAAAFMAKKRIESKLREEAERRFPS